MKWGRAIKRVLKILQGYGNVNIDVHFHNNSRKWEKFVKKYKPEVGLCGVKENYKEIFYTAKITIDGFKVTAYGPTILNPNFDEERANKKWKRLTTARKLLCGYEHGVVTIDKEKSKKMADEMADDCDYSSLNALEGMI